MRRVLAMMLLKEKGLKLLADQTLERNPGIAAEIGSPAQGTLSVLASDESCCSAMRGH